MAEGSDNGIPIPKGEGSNPPTDALHLQLAFEDGRQLVGAFQNSGEVFSNNKELTDAFLNGPHKLGEAIAEVSEPVEVQVLKVYGTPSVGSTAWLYRYEVDGEAQSYTVHTLRRKDEAGRIE